MLSPATSLLDLSVHGIMPVAGDFFRLWAGVTHLSQRWVDGC